MQTIGFRAFCVVMQTRSLAYTAGMGRERRANVTEFYRFQKIFYKKEEERLDRTFKMEYNTILHQYAQ